MTYRDYDRMLADPGVDAVIVAIADQFQMTDALQPVIETSRAAVRPAGDPKSDRHGYYLLGHASHLVDLARFLCGDITTVRAQLAEKYGAFS